MFLVVSYDIPDDRRRTKLHRHLKGFGMRVQYSVFECVLEEPEVARLQTSCARRSSAAKITCAIIVCAKTVWPVL